MNLKNSFSRMCAHFFLRKQSLVRSYRVIFRADTSTYLSFNLSPRHRFLLQNWKEQMLLLWTKVLAILRLDVFLNCERKKFSIAVLNPITLFCATTIIPKSNIWSTSWPVKNFWRVKESYEDNLKSPLIEAQANGKTDHFLQFVIDCSPLSLRQQVFAVPLNIHRAILKVASAILFRHYTYTLKV